MLFNRYWGTVVGVKTHPASIGLGAFEQPANVKKSAGNRLGAGLLLDSGANRSTFRGYEDIEIHRA